MYAQFIRTLNIVCLLAGLTACSEGLKAVSQSSKAPASTGGQNEESEVPGQTPAPAPIEVPPPGPGPQCGMQTNSAAVAYCDSFDKAFPIVGGSGQMDQRSWGVSRGGLELNIGAPWAWANSRSEVCGGINSTTYMNDIQVCNGRMYETTNDNLSGQFDAGGVMAMTMYPKQAFDFSGRTGTVAFDVTNDTAGSHSAWPEFWITDQAVPLPVTHFSPYSAPANGFGLRFSASCPAGQFCSCGSNENFPRFTVESAVVIRDWINEDVGSTGCDFGDPNSSCIHGDMTIEVLGCVRASTGPTGGLNHIEIKVNQNQIDVYATDAGTTSPLKHIAVVKKANLSLSRGFIWIEDKHYNADKGPTDRPSQRNHTFGWDNIAFDGPLVARDLAFEVPGAMVPMAGGYYLGRSTTPGQSPTMNTLPIGAADILAAKTATLLFTFYVRDAAPATISYKINGHAHTAPWPFPDRRNFTNRTISLPVPLTDLVMGPNQINIYSGTEHMEVGNVSLSLNGAAGIVRP